MSTEGVLFDIRASDETAQAFNSAEANLKKFRRDTAAATQELRTFQAAGRNGRAAMQQMGYQIQDIAVQLQGGTNPFMVLSQQGSQIASIFGPGGAAAGALIAIGGIIGGVLFPNMKKTKETTKDLADEMRELTINLKYATQAQLDLVAAQDRMKQSGLEDQLKQLNDESVALATERESIQQVLNDPAAAAMIGAGGISAYQNMVESIIKQEKEKHDQILILEARVSHAKNRALEEQEKAHKQWADTVAENENRIYEQQQEQYRAGIEAAEQAEKKKAAAHSAWADTVAENEARIYEQQSAQYAAGIERARKARDDLAKALEGVSNSLRSETQIIEDAYAEQLSVATEARTQSLIDEQEYTDLLIAIASHRAEQITAIEKDQADARKALQDTANEAFLQNMNRQTDILARAFNDTTALGKAFFLFQQSMAAANAIINGFDAAMKIRAAMPIGGEAMAQASIAMGFASAGAIMGQTIGSFEGGGFTGYGPRVGGLDGKGGTLAIVHPNETIIDHENGGGAATVNINISAMDKRGVSEFFESNRTYIYREVRNALADRGRSL